MGIGRLCVFFDEDRLEKYFVIRKTRQDIDRMFLYTFYKEFDRRVNRIGEDIVFFILTFTVRRFLFVMCVLLL